MTIMNRKIEWIDLLSLLGLCLSLTLLYFAWEGGVFESRAAFVHYVRSFGPYAVVLFILLQILQLFLPLLPSAMTVTAGVVLFGPLVGVFYNYVGISTGSILAFLLVRRYGDAALSTFVGQAKLQKYEAKLTNGKSFSRFFTFVIFLPFAPDNVVCYMAGLSDMSARRVILTILLGKPLSVALYSLGWLSLLQFIGAL